VVDLANELRLRDQEWHAYIDAVESVPSERRINLGKQAWRFIFRRGDEVLSIPLFTNPGTRDDWAVLPEDLDQVQITYYVQVPE
jgi:hypothetical protein